MPYFSFFFFSYPTTFDFRSLIFGLGELLASAGDDGNILLWAPSDLHHSAFGEDDADDKEKWTVKRMCRSSSGSEIYDLAWSPDGNFFITGSMDNVARIFDAQSGTMKHSRSWVQKELTINAFHR